MKIFNGCVLIVIVKPKHIAGATISAKVTDKGLGPFCDVVETSAQPLDQSVLTTHMTGLHLDLDFVQVSGTYHIGSTQWHGHGVLVK